MAKYSTLIAVLFVFTACGGGGGSTLVGATPPPEQVVIQQMFEGCGVDGLNLWRQIEDQPASLLEDGSPIPPSMFVMTINMDEAYFEWQTNLDADVPIDLEVRTQFQDANGDPMLPVPMPQFATVLGGDLLDAWTLVSVMPVGSRIVHTISTPKAQPGEPVIDAVITHTVGVGGVVASSAGDYSADDGQGCTTTLQWMGLALPSPAYQSDPVQGVLGVSIGVGVSDTIAGSLSYNGALPADLELGLNGGSLARYGYDLTTDIVSPR